jgi:hypothetical protein
MARPKKGLSWKTRVGRSASSRALAIREERWYEWRGPAVDDRVCRRGDGDEKGCKVEVGVVVDPEPDSCCCNISLFSFSCPEASVSSAGTAGVRSGDCHAPARGAGKGGESSCAMGRIGLKRGGAEHPIMIQLYLN